MRRSAQLAILALGLLAVPFAANAEEDTFNVAMRLHRDERYLEAAAKFIVAYSMHQREPVAAYNAACALARAGKKDGAFVWLDRAQAAGFDLADYIDDDDDLDSLRGDPRFAQLRAKVTKGRKAHADEPKLKKDKEAPGIDDDAREHYHAGRFKEAARAYVEAAAREEHPATSLYNAACSKSLAGDKAGALDLLQRSVEAGFADPKHIQEDEDLELIRNEPRFRQIRQLAAELEAPDFNSQGGKGPPPETVKEWRAALPRIEAAAQKHGQLGQVWFNLGLARLVLGQAEKGIAPFEKAVELGYRKPTSMYNAACANALAGRTDQAFAWLDKAVASGFDDWWLITEDRDLASLRGDARFRKYRDLARRHQHD